MSILKQSFFTLTPTFSPAFADLLAEQVFWQARAASRRQASRERQKVSIGFDNLFCAVLFWNLRGAVAQLGERLNGIQEADGSIPFSSTI